MKTTKPQADFTYDRETDQFVVRLDDGTEVCQTSSPHTSLDRSIALDITMAVNDGEIRQMGDGSWDISLTPAWLQGDIKNHRVTFYPHSN